MIWVATELARQQLAEADAARVAADLAKREGRPAGGAPLHAMADGAEDFHDGERRKRAARAEADAEDGDVMPGEDRDGDDPAEKTARHPQTGQFAAESEYSPFGLQRSYIQPGHAIESPSNAVGPHVAPVPDVGTRVGYQPIADAISTHGVARTQVPSGPVTHEAPAPPPN